MWLDLGHFGRTDESHSCEAVLNRPRLKGSQDHSFVVVERHDELAALVEGQPTCCAVRPEHLSACSAQR